MKSQTTRIFAVSIFLLAVIFAVIPLFGRRYIPTHDGEYHMIRIVEFARMMGQGYIFPRWAPTLNSGYGIPVFQYHYPFPNYMGVFVRLMTHDAVLAFQMAMGIGYLAMAVGLLYWLSSLFSFRAALVGAAVGAFVPYIFVDMYVRGSIGEIWATVFLFWSLYCIEKKRYPLLAISYGLLILSHNILGMLYTPFLLIYSLLRDKITLWSLLGGVGLSAYFWLPAIAEHGYVVGLNTVNFREHFVEVYEMLIPSWGSEFSGVGNIGNKISFQIGIASLIAIMASVFTFLRQKNKKMRTLYLFFCFVGILAVIGMLPVSLGLWEIVWPLQFIQYPWRLLSFMIPIAAFAAAFWAHHIKRFWPGVMLAVFAVIVSMSYTRSVTYEPRNESYYLSRPNFTDGTSSMGNSFSTVWTGWKKNRAKFPLTTEHGRLMGQTRAKYLDREFIVHMDKQGIVTINTVYFPGWIVTVDKRPVPIDYKTDGLMRIFVSEGQHVLRIQYTETSSRVVGNFISIISFVVVAVWGILHLYARRH